MKPYPDDKWRTDTWQGLRRVIVYFDMWGQRCSTEFTVMSELDPLRWLRTCHEKGFLMPIRIEMDNGLVWYSEDELDKIFSE